MRVTNTWRIVCVLYSYVATYYNIIAKVDFAGTATPDIHWFFSLPVVLAATDLYKISDTNYSSYNARLT